jgi:hypothetical protein
MRACSWSGLKQAVGMSVPAGKLRNSMTAYSRVALQLGRCQEVMCQGAAQETHESIKQHTEETTVHWKQLVNTLNSHFDAMNDTIASLNVTISEFVGLKQGQDDTVRQWQNEMQTLVSTVSEVCAKQEHDGMLEGEAKKAYELRADKESVLEDIVAAIQPVRADLQQLQQQHAQLQVRV